jgi:hypothetical protein
MSSLSDRLYAQARITPIKRENQVKAIERLSNGALRVSIHNGQSYDIAPEDVELQAFVVYTVLNDAARA